jgi:TatD DNase family protein
MVSLIDIGINLMHRSFQEDREQVVERAEAAGVSPLIITGTSIRSSEAGAAYAGKNPGKLFATAGVHPHDASSCTPDTLKRLHRLAALPQVVAVGECGLDYNRDFSPRDVQRKWFEEQVKLACELKLPLFLHEREAHRDFLDVMKPYHADISRAVVHCFTGTRAELEAYLEQGFYIGITGWICDERRGKHLRELVKHIPLDRLMIETDAPFLTPRDMLPKPLNNRNEPAFLPHVLRALAHCTGQTPEAAAEATTRTAKTFFGLV